MQKAGCKKIGFGVESGVERVRFLDHKKISNKQISDAIKLCHKYNIISVCSFIFGHPTETKAEMKETLNFSIKIGSDYNYYSKMMPIPNSELFEIAKNTNKIPANIWRSYMLGEISHPIFYPDTVDQESMDRIYRWAWIRFYLSGRNIKQKFKVILSPRMFIRSLKAFIILVSGKKYR